MTRIRPFPAWILLWVAVVIFSPEFVIDASAQDDIRQRLAAGEIIASTQEVSGTSAKRGEVIGVIAAPPGIVWQVITDINNFKNFMPRTLNSMAVAPEKLPLVLQRRPSRAAEVEQLLGPVPPDPASYRLPGGAYICYLYSHLEFPWPCSNRWYIIRLQQDETRAAQDCYHSSRTLVAGNLRENRGEWILEPFDSTRTKVTYRLLADPGGAIPGFLVNQGTCVSMPQIITAVRERAAKVCINR